MGSGTESARRWLQDGVLFRWQADKRLQLADWRIRPLTADMLHYARADTHSLLYIYDCLKVCVPQHPTLFHESPSSIKQQLM